MQADSVNAKELYSTMAVRITEYENAILDMKQHLADYNIGTVRRQNNV